MVPDLSSPLLQHHVFPRVPDFEKPWIFSSFEQSMAVINSLINFIISILIENKTKKKMNWRTDARVGYRKNDKSFKTL